MTMTAHTDRPLRVLHVLRAPLGGLFRHVVDLAREQAARGHAVGLVADSLTGGDRANDELSALAPKLKLGVTRVPMRRNPHWTDLLAYRHVTRRIAECRPDVVHGHGSKGGLFARAPGLAPGAFPCVRAYTPHGGSFNYRPGTGIALLYMAAERILARATDIFMFESAYIGERCEANVPGARALKRVVHNGISLDEAIPVNPAADAADFIYVGELRSAKGIDTLIDALALLIARTGRRSKAVLVGSGPDAEALAARAKDKDIEDRVAMPGAMPARLAFPMGRVLLVPSRAESLPYVVIEATAAHMPIIATNVGGIPEIFGPYADRLIPCDDVERLAGEMQAELALQEDQLRHRADDLAAFVVDHFTISNMVDGIIAGYRDAIAAQCAKPAGATNAISTA